MSSQPAMAAFPVREAAWSGRVWNLLGALILLILLAPLMLATAVAIVALSGRSPLVAHRRAGQFGAPFWTLKFRSMWSGWTACPGLIEHIVDDIGPEHKSSDDPRVASRFARFCRRFSIDELPQLVNVLRGEMALVGPRPLTESELRKHYGFDAEETLRVKPGVTGLWQVTGRSRLTYPERRAMDLYLVRNRSWKLHAAILLRTIPAVLSGKDGW